MKAAPALTLLLGLGLACLGARADGARDEVITKATEKVTPSVVAWRRDFHQHPELSNREVRTAAKVIEQLRSMGVSEIRTNVARNGVVALIQGSKPGGCIALRADMDGLPIDEVMDVPYRSLNRGVKHACGHDAHTAILLGVAQVLMGMRDQFSGTVKLVFQPAEEGPPPGEEGGAEQMILEGALENPRPSAILGLHVWPTSNAGQVVHFAGPMMASTDRFRIEIIGKMSHGGAAPHKGVDAVVVAAEAIQALQTIRSRKLDPLEPFVLSIGTIHGGNRYNILAESVVMEGTYRTLNEGLRMQINGLITNTLAGVTAAHGASYKFELQTKGNPVTYNELQLAEKSGKTLRRMLGDAQVLKQTPTMGGEDFAYFQKAIPGYFFFLGCANPAKGITAGAHTPEFDIDEACLPIGVKLMTGLALDRLEEVSAK